MDDPPIQEDNGTPQSLQALPADGATARSRSEPELRAVIVQALRASGIAVEEQVICDSGAADIVTVDRSVVIEVKYRLTRREIQRACGQVLLYKQAINPDARAIVIGYATDETANLIDWAAMIGIEVVRWVDGVEGKRLKAKLLTPSSSIGHQPAILRWNVQSLALSHDITRVADLAPFLGLPRQGLYGVWRGTAVNISVARLERFAQRLAPTPEDWLRPGDWFRWNGGRLNWAVREVAEQVGLDAAQLAFAANLYPQQIAWFWTGEAKFVFVDTLAKLAAALETEARAFDVGELFVKAEN
jgi:DNA-binding Xre family transcriptional regulator